MFFTGGHPVRTVIFFTAAIVITVAKAAPTIMASIVRRVYRAINGN